MGCITGSLEQHTDLTVVVVVVVGEDSGAALFKDYARDATEHGRAVHVDHAKGVSICEK